MNRKKKDGVISYDDIWYVRGTNIELGRLQEVQTDSIDRNVYMIFINSQGKRALTWLTPSFFDIYYTKKYD